MNWWITVLLSQYLISATAGLVGQVRGNVNVKMAQRVAAGTLVETGADGLVDLQLNPGAFLRLRKDSAAVFESTSLDDIDVDVKRGMAIIDFGSADPKFPIKVKAGSLTVQFRSAGVYGISPDSLKVFDGHVEVSAGTVLKKGEGVLADKGAFKPLKLPKDEVQHPYAPDRLKVYLRPKEEKNHKIPMINSMFAEYVQRNFRDLHDVQIVTAPEGADYFMTVGATQKSGYRATRGGLGIFAEVELKDTGGVVVLSNQQDDMDPNDLSMVTSSDLFFSGNYTAKKLIQDVMNKTGWR